MATRVCLVVFLTFLVVTTATPAVASGCPETPTDPLAASGCAVVAREIKKVTIGDSELALLDVELAAGYRLPLIFVLSERPPQSGFQSFGGLSVVFLDCKSGWVCRTGACFGNYPVRDVADLERDRSFVAPIPMAALVGAVLGGLSAALFLVRVFMRLMRKKVGARSVSSLRR